MQKTARNLAVLGTGLGVSAVVGWLLLRESKRSRDDGPSRILVRSQTRQEPEEIKEIVLPLEALEADEPTPDAPASTTEDDLTAIKDIGQRFADALHAIGITRYDQLAGQTPDDLAARLAPHVTVRAQRIRDNDWIGQAARLASGQTS